MHTRYAHDKAALAEAHEARNLKGSKVRHCAQKTLPQGLLEGLRKQIARDILPGASRSPPAPFPFPSPSAHSVALRALWRPPLPFRSLRSAPAAFWNSPSAASAAATEVLQRALGGGLRKAPVGSGTGLAELKKSSGGLRRASAGSGVLRRLAVLWRAPQELWVGGWRTPDGDPKPYANVRSPAASAGVAGRAGTVGQAVVAAVAEAAKAAGLVVETALSLLQRSSFSCCSCYSGSGAAASAAAAAKPPCSHVRDDSSSTSRGPACHGTPSRVTHAAHSKRADPQGQRQPGSRSQQRGSSSQAARSRHQHRGAGGSHGVQLFAHAPISTIMRTESPSLSMQQHNIRTELHFSDAEGMHGMRTAYRGRARAVRRAAQSRGC
jgi:hypothetical protein